MYHPIQQIPQNNLQQNNAQSLQRDNMPRRTDVKPRGRMTAYTYFVKSCHQEHKKKHPKRKIFPQFFSKNCGKRWKIFQQTPKLLANARIKRVLVRTNFEAITILGWTSPHVGFTARGANEISGMRKTMSDIEKKRFHEMAEKDKKRYDTEMQNYTPPKGKNKDIEKKRFHEMAEKNKKRYDTEMQNHTPKGENKGRGKKRKHIKDHNAPKRSLSAFFWFCNDERGKVKMLNPEYGMGDIAKELGKKWSNADPETISKYVAMAEKDKARYERERRNAYKKKIQNNGAPVVETITISDSEWEEWEDVEDDDE
ncbi:High mobility group protein DSP1 [Temnothorax longispinosus]|uniref:High mobility group protein DSP1 n=1 Tax=Temnothorax longispinosus TaxID=300112 RepID=A0A4S2JQ71_9HYME|nr:High mobility group protein DSP1 [Temnothorax longispinosus]